MKLIYLSEAWRMFHRSLKVRRKGYMEYLGNNEEIARQIIDSCWNPKKNYFMVSPGHFSEFYTRDFGMCAEALTQIGYKYKVHQTLDYAINKFRKHGAVTTTISPDGKCFDFPCYAVDSLPFLVHAIKVSGAEEILFKNIGFMKEQVDSYFRKVFDAKKSMVRKDLHFSSIKDHSQRKSSCYDNCMVYMLQKDLSDLGFYNPFASHDIAKSITDNFWNTNYFFEDMDHKPLITGDANVFPFWCGVINDKDIFDRCISSVESVGLASPFPLKYTVVKGKIGKMIPLDSLSGGYERDTVWAHLGMCFLDICSDNDPERLKRYISKYTELIHKNKNFFEVYDRHGNPFKTSFYASDDSMLWVSKYLYIKKLKMHSSL